MSAPRNQTQNPPSSTVFVRNLPYDINDDEIRQFFSPAGNPSRISFHNDRETGKFKGTAFVEFPSIEIAHSAVRNLNKSPLKGREIGLDFSRSAGNRGGPNRHHNSHSGSHAHHGHAPPDIHGGSMAPNNTSSAVSCSQHAPPPPGTMYHASGGIAYHQVGGASANGQAVGAPGQQIVFQGQPQMGPGNQMVVPGGAGPTLIMTPDGQILQGPGPPGGMVVQGGQQMIQGAPAGAEGGTVGQHPQQVLLRPHGAPGPPGPPQAGAVDAPGNVAQMNAMQIPPHVQGGVLPPRAPHELQPDVPVGMPTAQHAAQQAAHMLGNPHSAMAPSQQAATSTIAGMSPKQLFKILTELKAQMQADPEKGRVVLRENLPLTKALFQAQILLGMVNPDQPAMVHHNPPPQPAPSHASNAGGAAVKEEGAAHGMGAPAADPREAALANVGPQQREMLLKVMNLTPDAIARLSESQQQQVDKVKQWAADHGIKI